MVRSSDTAGKELAADYSPESLGGYLSKLNQAVPVEWRRRVSYSKAWPKLPGTVKLAGVRYSLDVWPITTEWEVANGHLSETTFGVYRRTRFATCGCFDDWESPDRAPGGRSGHRHAVFRSGGDP